MANTIRHAKSHRKTSTSQTLGHRPAHQWAVGIRRLPQRTEATEREIWDRGRYRDRNRDRWRTRFAMPSPSGKRPLHKRSATGRPTSGQLGSGDSHRGQRTQREKNGIGVGIGIGIGIEGKHDSPCQAPAENVHFTNTRPPAGPPVGSWDPEIATEDTEDTEDTEATERKIWDRGRGRYRNRDRWQTRFAMPSPSGKRPLHKHSATGRPTSRQLGSGNSHRGHRGQRGQREKNGIGVGIGIGIDGKHDSPC
jgi:hypothetical protein